MFNSLQNIPTQTVNTFRAIHSPCLDETWVPQVHCLPVHRFNSSQYDRVVLEPANQKPLCYRMCFTRRACVARWWLEAWKTHSFENKLIVLKVFDLLLGLSFCNNNDRTEEARRRDGSGSRRGEEAPDRAGGCSAVPAALCYGKTES